MATDEIISEMTARHFKRLESRLLELDLPSLAYVAISREFRHLENDLKKALAFQGEDLKNILTGGK